MNEIPPHSHDYDSVDFGYQDVPKAEKSQRVADVFSRVATRYDVMNDAMSLGLHRLWKRTLVRWANPQPGDQVLDIAAGTGDLSLHLAPKVAPLGRVWMTDINPEMLAVGRERVIDAGWHDVIDVRLADAEALPFEEGSMDMVFCAFGLRNMTDKAAVLGQCRRVLKPGGRAWIMEFSMPKPSWMKRLYHAYSFGWIPKLGQCLADDADSYQYLVESIRRHPDPETLRQVFLDQGFDDCRVYPILQGTVVVHEGRVW